jgi:hypothetical protein
MRWIILKHVKCRESILLNERGKYSISCVQWEEYDKMGFKTGSWRVVYVLRFSKNSVKAEEAGWISYCQLLYPTPTAIPPNRVLEDEI